MNDTTSRGTFWLILSRAFLPPMEQALARAVREFLADDMDELCQTLGLDAAEALAELRQGLANLAAGDALLIHYSGLFLAPPVKARLNLCHYLDGNANGDAMDAIEHWHARLGLTRHDRFRDLPDHIAAMFEIMAYVAGSDDEAEFGATFLAPALPRLARDVARTEPASPYGALLGIAQATLTVLMPRAGREPANRRPRARRRNSSAGVWQACERCGQTIARVKEIRIMVKALAAAGLPAEHLKLCSACRPAGPGWFASASMQ